MAVPRIKDTLMQTVDGVEIKTGMKLYYSNPKTRWDHESKLRIKTSVVESMEVIHVNYTTRAFLVRNSTGTETRYTMSGRALTELFGKISSAKKAAKAESMEQITELRSEIAKQNKILNMMLAEYKAI